MTEIRQQVAMHIGPRSLSSKQQDDEKEARDQQI